MKKLLGLILAIPLAASLAACGGIAEVSSLPRKEG
jgi:hypothetical protein